MRISDWSSDVCSSDLFEMAGTPFKARLARWRGDKIERLSIGTEADARAAEADVKAGHFTVDAVETKPLTRNPPPAFTHPTLQQEAATIGRAPRRDRACQYV